MTKTQETLLSHPLFLGVSKNELQSLMESAPNIAERLFQRNKPIVEKGDTCQELIVVLEGIVSVISSPEDNKYNIREMARAPFSPQCDCLFGLSPKYTRTVMALSQCRCLIIDKQTLMQFLETSAVIRLNYLNMLSAIIHKRDKSLWSVPAKDLRTKITRFFKWHVQNPMGEVYVFITISRLADEISENRMEVSAELHRMEEENLLACSRGKIVIYKFQDLLK